MFVEWRPLASEDLERILTYISERNIAAAINLNDDIERAVEALPQQPYQHRPGRVTGTREIVAHPNYIVVYRVGADRIEITNVIHARQQYP
jgi:plasmid stabilization system protein ParE